MYLINDWFCNYKLEGKLSFLGEKEMMWKWWRRSGRSVWKCELIFNIIKKDVIIFKEVVFGKKNINWNFY